MVNNRKNSLSKAERLSWKRYIDLLFEKGKSFVAFPLRVIFLPVEKAEAPVSILVSIPKKRIRRAHLRNRIKRQVRETYRVGKHELAEKMAEGDKSMLVAFLYIDNTVHPFPDMEKAMAKALKILKEKP